MAWGPQLAAVVVDSVPQQIIPCWLQGAVGFPKSPRIRRAVSSPRARLKQRKADPAVGWSHPTAPPFLCGGAVEMVTRALEGSPSGVSQRREWRSSCTRFSPRHPWQRGCGSGGESAGAAGYESFTVAGGPAAPWAHSANWPKFIVPSPPPTSAVPSAWLQAFSCFMHLWSQPLRPGKAVTVTQPDTGLREPAKCKPICSASRLNLCLMQHRTLMTHRIHSHHLANYRYSKFSWT